MCKIDNPRAVMKLSLTQNKYFYILTINYLMLIRNIILEKAAVCHFNYKFKIQFLVYFA